MFLFSGTFFPISQLPDWLQPVAWVTPLWHGVELCRDLALGEPRRWPARSVHVAVPASRGRSSGTSLALRVLRRGGW